MRSTPFRTENARASIRLAPKALQQPMINCKGLWKIFGASNDRQAQRVIEAVKQGQTKQEILKSQHCVVGVADVNLSINEGETFCVMGLSGSGKSTLIRHINRLVEPSAGSILIGGHDIGQLPKRELRALRLARIGMVFQHMALFPHRPVWWNVAYGLHLRGVAQPERRQVALEMLRLVHLEDAADIFPPELSGGMQQRVGIARALATKPAIMLMDEPFSALDPIIRVELQKQFLDLSKQVKKTTVVITHDLDEAMKLGDRVAIMRDGRIVQVGTPEDIVLNPVDEYVRRFLRDVPRSKILSAQSIMSPGARPDTPGPRVNRSAKLESVVTLASPDTDIVVADDEDCPIGTISNLNLLRALA